MACVPDQVVRLFAPMHGLLVDRMHETLSLFHLLALEVSLTPLDKGLEAFLRILALQDGCEIRSQAMYRFLFTTGNCQASGCQRGPHSQRCLLSDCTAYRHHDPIYHHRNLLTETAP
jgi:hypothetical protein